MLKILAVDDSPSMRAMIQQSLADDYQVLVANNAEEAMDVLSQEAIAALLLDISMPGIDGLELCRTIRSLEQFYDLPIIMLTARDRAFDKIQGRMAGATEYITKPFDAEQLHSAIERCVRHQKEEEAGRTGDNN